MIRVNLHAYRKSRDESKQAPHHIHLIARRRDQIASGIARPGASSWKLSALSRSLRARARALSPSQRHRQVQHKLDTAHVGNISVNEHNKSPLSTTPGDGKAKAVWCYARSLREDARMQSTLRVGGTTLRPSNNTKWRDARREHTNQLYKITSPCGETERKGPQS